MQLFNPTSVFHTSSAARSTRRRGRPCVIVGAGEAGRAVARDLRRVQSFGITPIGFLDDRLAGRRRVAAGLPILGRTDDLASVARARHVEAGVVAIPSLPNREIQRLAAAGAAEGLTVRFLPSFGTALERPARLSDLRHLSMSRLLGRDERRVVRPASAAVVAGKRVLVTGAGGSIGSELCRQVRSFGAAQIVLLDHDESNLHRLKLELEGEALLESDDVVIADIRDRSRIEQIFRERRPEVVFHAAAHKHLPLLEQHPCEGAKANVFGTRTLVEVAVAYDVERFILISTDKAADPTSVLGATKRIAEMIVGSHAISTTKLASVRFGNVLGSRGSFVSVLAEQVERGDPVTVTHPDVTRFFMTVEEAVGLVLESAAMAEFGEVFVLDMGEPVRILDLVHNYAAQLHLDPRDIEIRYTGLRPGEKLHEALFAADEHRIATAHPRIMATRPRAESPDELAAGLDRLWEAANANRAPDVRAALAEIVVGYRPSREADHADGLCAYYPDDF
jgi:FlaA1/EpsC-like NDP-sugar epimerase